MVEISEKTALTLKRMLSRSIDKKVWLKENRPENIKDMDDFQKKIDTDLEAYKELEEALAP